jgi:glycerol uptake facilitator-like aquaporin
MTCLSLCASRSSSSPHVRHRPSSCGIAGQCSVSVGLTRRLIGEGLDSAFLLAAVVGSGIMADRLFAHEGLALLANSLATGAALVMLIYTFGPISGAHFNPVVTLAEAIDGSVVLTFSIARALP